MEYTDEREIKFAILMILLMIVSVVIVIVTMVRRNQRYNMAGTTRVVNSASFYYVSLVSNKKEIPTTNIYDKLKLTILLPDFGDVRIDEKGHVSVALKYGNKCYKKKAGETEIVTEKYSVTNCIPEI